MYANGQEVTTLARANEERVAQGLEELKLEDFDGETQDAVDWGIAHSYELADVDKANVVSEVKATLAASRETVTDTPTTVEPPAGYERQEDTNLVAYVKSDYVVPEQAIKLLIGAANGCGQDHQSARTTGWDTSWTAYVHLYGDNTLYAYTADGEHTDGWPKVSVVGGGNVNAGRHDFVAW